MAPSPRLIAIQDLASRLHVCRRTVYRLLQADGSFPRPIRIGGRIVFVEAELDTYIAARMADRPAGRAA